MRSKLASAALLIETLVYCLPREEALLPCGNAFFHTSMYTCYDGDFLCPVLDGEPTLRCGPDCYLPEMYSCDQDKLLYPPDHSGHTTSCSEDAVTQQLSDPPYENYFYSDCHSATQVVVTSPLESSNLTIIGPRLLVAWPAGNSGAVAFFKPSNGINGTLSIGLKNSTDESQPLHGVYQEPESTSLSGNPTVGVSTLFDLNSPAVLTVPILGSIRNIRDFTEGPSLLYPIIQDAINFTEIEGGGVRLSRLWLDNMTTTSISFIPINGAGIMINNRTLEMDAGTYNFTATFDYFTDWFNPLPGSFTLLSSGSIHLFGDIHFWRHSLLPLSLLSLSLLLLSLLLLSLLLLSLLPLSLLPLSRASLVIHDSLGFYTSLLPHS